VDVLDEPHAREVQLAGRAVATPVQLSSEDEADAETGADREEDEVVDTPGDAKPLLAERREVDVVLEGGGDPEAALELLADRPAVERREVREVERRIVGVDHPGQTDDGAVDEPVVEAGRPYERLAQRADRVEGGLRVGGRELDVLAGPDRAGEVADG